MAKKITERRLVDVLVRHYRDANQVGREVPHYEKRIDVVVLNDAGTLEAIEAKISNWPRAIQQAILNLTAVEYSSIAVWVEVIHRVDHERLQEHGIGLISVGTKWGDVKQVLSPRKSLYTNRYVRESMAGELREKQR